jgi:hypothetical protein
MPNLREVEINDNTDLDISKLVAFLKANPQLRKLKTRLDRCDQEIFITVLSSKHLEHWDIYHWNWSKIELNSLPSNYSIKYLDTHKSRSFPSIL